MKKHLLSCLLVAWCAAAVFAQRTVTGLVIDAAGAPLGGTNVRIKNDSKSGAVADSDGRFSIAVPREGATLIFSYTGFEPFETLLGASNELTVQLAESRVLTDVVVTALGITRSEKSLGYATAQVDGSEIDKVRDPNIVNLLSGRAAGVQVVGSNGNLGGSARVTIRGIKSISGNNQPLFVVDGVPMDNSNFTNEWQTRGGYGQLHESQVDYGSTIQDLNPDDIENISILKGQAAAALYGSRGVNGVVMVTTKKGATKRKGIGVSINSSLTFDQVAVRPRFQNKYGGGVNLLPRGYADGSGFYKTPLLEIGEAGDTIGSFSSFDLVPIYAVDESNGLKFATSTDEHFQSLQDGGGYLFPSGFGANQSNLNFRDWNSWDAWDSQNFGKSRVWEAGDDPFSFFETGISSSHNIALEGAGAGGAAFRLSFTRFDQKGILPNSHLERNTLSFNGSLPVGKKLEAFVGANYVNSATLGRASSTYDGRGGTNPASNFSQWWHTELRFDDLKNYENPDGTLRTWNRQSADNPRPQFWDNPYWSRYKNYQNDGRDRIFGNVGLTWKINSWLTATGRVLTDFYNEKREERIATSSLTIAQYTQDLIKVGENNADLILRGNHRFSEKWTLDAFVGGNQMRRKSDRVLARRSAD